MDFRFKYDRHKPSPEQQAERKRQDRERIRLARGLAYGLAIPLLLLSGPLAGWLLGSWLDKLFGTTFVMPLLILLGLASGLKGVIDLLLRLSRS